MKLLGLLSLFLLGGSHIFAFGHPPIEDFRNSSSGFSSSTSTSTTAPNRIFAIFTDTLRRRESTTPPVRIELEDNTEDSSDPESRAPPLRPSHRIRLPSSSYGRSLVFRWEQRMETVKISQRAPVARRCENVLRELEPLARDAIDRFPTHLPNPNALDVGDYLDRNDNERFRLERQCNIIYTQNGLPDEIWPNLVDVLAEGGRVARRIRATDRCPVTVDIDPLPESPSRLPRRTTTSTVPPPTSTIPRTAAAPTPVTTMPRRVSSTTTTTRNPPVQAVWRFYSTSSDSDNFSNASRESSQGFLPQEPIRLPPSGFGRFLAGMVAPHLEMSSPSRRQELEELSSRIIAELEPVINRLIRTLPEPIRPWDTPEIQTYLNEHPDFAEMARSRVRAVYDRFRWGEAIQPPIEILFWEGGAAFEDETPDSAADNVREIDGTHIDSEVPSAPDFESAAEPSAESSASSPELPAAVPPVIPAPAYPELLPCRYSDPIREDLSAADQTGVMDPVPISTSTNSASYRLRPRTAVDYIATRIISESGSSERGIFVLPNLDAHDSDSSYAPSEDEVDPMATRNDTADVLNTEFQPASFQDLLPWLVGHAIQNRRILDADEELPSMAEDRDERLGEQLLALERIFPRSPRNRVFRLYAPSDRILERISPTLRGIRNPWYRIPRSLCSEWINLR